MIPATDWVRVTCNSCGRVIAGYPKGAQPSLLEIHHQCNPQRDTYYVTVLRA